MPLAAAPIPFANSALASYLCDPPLRRHSIWDGRMCLCLGQCAFAPGASPSPTEGQTARVLYRKPSSHEGSRSRVGDRLLAATYEQSLRLAGGPRVRDARGRLYYHFASNRGCCFIIGGLLPTEAHAAHIDHMPNQFELGNKPNPSCHGDPVLVDWSARSSACLLMPGDAASIRAVSRSTAVAACREKTT